MTQKQMIEALTRRVEELEGAQKDTPKLVSERVHEIHGKEIERFQGTIKYLLIFVQVTVGIVAFLIIFLTGGSYSAMEERADATLEAKINSLAGEIERELENDTEGLIKKQIVEITSRELERAESEVVARAGEVVRSSLTGGQLQTVIDDVSARLKSTTASDLIGVPPIGTILPFAGTEAPLGYRFCDGSSLDSSQYPKLASILGNRFLNNPPAGEARGIGVPVGKFILPDLRGVFLRGLDKERGIDPDRNLGSFQKDQVGVHNHRFETISSSFAFSFQTPKWISAGADEGDLEVYNLRGEPIGWTRLARRTLPSITSFVLNSRPLIH